MMNEVFYKIANKLHLYFVEEYTNHYISIANLHKKGIISTDEFEQVKANNIEYTAPGHYQGMVIPFLRSLNKDGNFDTAILIRKFSKNKTAKKFKLIFDSNCDLKEFSNHLNNFLRINLEHKELTVRNTNQNQTYSCISLDYDKQRTDFLYLFVSRVNDINQSSKLNSILQKYELNTWGNDNIPTYIKTKVKPNFRQLLDLCTETLDQLYSIDDKSRFTIWTNVVKV